MLENLQVLCSKCSRTKGNKDDAEFRAGPTPEKQPGCRLCELEETHAVTERNGTAFALLEQPAEEPGHMLVVPTRHSPDYFWMSTVERADADDPLRYLRKNIEREDSSIRGFRVQTDSSNPAVTIAHAPIHLLPRRLLATAQAVS